MRFWRVLSLLSLVFFFTSQLSGQTTLLTNAGATYTNTDGPTFDSYGPVDISTCATVIVSFDYEFSLPWVNSGNMESADECGSFGDPCLGDPSDPTGGGCNMCWDFLLGEFNIDGSTVDSDLIGDTGTTDAEQTGSMNFSFCNDAGASTAELNITTQTWAASESITFSNIAIICYESVPTATVTPDEVCAGETVDLEATVNDNAAVNISTWTGPGDIDDASSLSTFATTAGAGTETYTITTVDPLGCVTSDDVDVTVNSTPVANLPPPVIVCYSLAPIEGEILNLDPVLEAIRNFDASLTVNWFFDMDAMNPLDPTDPGDLVTLIINLQTTVYATVTDGTCESAPVPVSIELNTYPDNPNGTLTECRGANGNAEFTPSDADDQFNGGDPSISISYHGSSGDAEDNMSPITGIVSTPMDLTIFVRIENAAGCASVAELELIVEDGVTANPASLEACDDGSGQATFDLTTVESTILGGQSGTVLFYEDMAATIDISNPGSYTSGPGTIYAVIDDGSGCVSPPEEVDLSVVSINPADVFLSFDPTSGCGNTVINMTLNTPSDPPGDWTFNVSFGPVSVGAVSNGDFLGSDGDTPFTIGVNEDYVFVLNSVTAPGPLACEIIFSPGIEYIIPIANAPDAFPAEITACADEFGEATYDLTLLESTINGNTGFAVDFYQDFSLTSLITNPSAYVSAPGTIFAVVDAGGGCISDPVPINLFVEEAPDPVDFTLDITSSCTATDVTLTFSLPNGDAFNFDLLITDGTGTSVSSYSGITNFSMLTFSVTETTTFSIEEIQSSFGCIYTLDPAPSQTITIGSSGAMPDPASLSACDDGSGQATFDLTSVDNTVNGGSGETVLWFEDAAGNTPIGTPNSYQSGGGTVYAALLVAGCISTTVEVDLTVLELPDININLDQGITCSSSATATISVNTNGTGPFDFDWNDDTYDGLQTLIDIPAGFYAVTVSDGDMCEAFADITITDPPAVSLDCSVLSDETTPGANDGEASFTFNNGTAPYEALLTGPVNQTESGLAVNTFVFDNLPPGNYTITVTDDNGCSADCMFTINPSNCDLSIMLDAEDVSCNGFDDGTIDMFISNGAGPLSFDWSDDQYDGQSNLFDLPPGTYAVTVTDANSCTDEAQVTINEPAPLNLECRANSDGEGNGPNSYTFIYSGGTPFYLLDLAGPVNISFTENTPGEWDTAVLPAGNYTFTLTDDNGCTEVCTFIITQICDLTLQLDGTDPSCAGEASGSLDLIISSSEDIILIDWNDDSIDGQTNPTGLQAGTYIVTVFDELGCEETASFVLNDPPAYDLSCEATTLPSGPLATDGVLTVVVNAGPGGPYTVTYDNGTGSSGTIPEGVPANSFTQSNLPAGIYTISVSNADGCLASCTIDLTPIPCPLNLDQGTTGPNCSDSNDGTATVTPTDGTMPYVYDWSDDQFDGMDTATGLMAGQSISVTVTDAAGCVGIVDFLLPTPDAIILDCSSIADPTNNTSNDGQADIAVNGGVPPYTVTWTGPVSGSDDLPTEGSYLINGLSVGSYTVMIEDSNGCTTSCNFDLTGANCDLTLDLQGTNPDCAGEASGSLDLFIDGSFPIVSIDWNEDSYDGIEDHVDVPAGTFNVTVIDNQGCVASTSLTLVDPPALFVNCSQTTNPSTNISTDGEVDVVIAGGSAGYTISWAGPVSGSTTAATPGTINIGNLSVGSYTITIEDNNGCTVTCDFVLTTPNTCTFDLVFTTMDETCPEAADGSVFVAPSGATPGFTYNWNTTAATPTIQNLNAGTYIVTVTDANDCVAIDSVTIVTANASPTLLAGMGGSICLDSCFSLPLDLGGQAPFTVDYVLEAGGSMTNAQATFSNALDTLIICPAADGIPPGPFSVNFTRISDANCQTPLTETVSFEYLEPGIEDFMSTICLGDTIMIAGEVFHQTNPSGTVIIPQGASNGCDSIINVTLDFFPLSTFDLGQTICVEDSLFVGGTAFHFNNPTGSVTLENASTNGCDSIVNVDLTFFPVSTFDLMPTICPEDTITVGGQDFHFDNPTGTVILENASASGCDSTVVVDLSFFPPSTLNLAPTICMEDTITVGDEQFFLGNSTGVVILENASSNGCDSTITVNLSFFPASELEITDDICQGDTIIIAGQEFFSGQLSDTIVLDNAASNGCDSTIFVNLVELLPGTTQIQSDLCAGDTLIIDGITFTEDFLQDTIQLAGQASNGCDSLVFVDLNLIPLVATPLAATICSGDSLTVGDSILITTGTYDILIDNGSTNGCDSLVQVALNVLPAISENVTGTFCADESITVGNETFDISNPTGTVLIPDGSINGCDSTVVVDLTFVPAAINDLDTLLCFGESLTIGSQVFDMDNPSGIVVLTNGASSGCDSTIFVNTTYRPELTASLGPDTIVCGDQNLDGILELTPGPLYSFELEFSTGFQLSVDDVAGGQYNFALGPITQNVTVTLNSITAADGCAVTLLDDQANIQYSDAQLSLLSIGGGLGTDISCANEMDGAIQAAISGGIGPFTYQWNTGDDEQILDGLGTGDYSVTVTDLPGCTTEASISLTAPNPINIMLDGNSAGCFGTATGSLSISNISGGTAPYEFSLDNEFFQALDSNLLIPNLAAGPYTVFVQDANDCQFSFNGAVPEALELQLELGDDEVIQVGDSILIKPQIDFAPASWTWTPTNGISQPDTFITFVAPLETTIYQLELVDENGCEVSDLIRIIVEKDIDVFIPTAFSPDGDGTNDLFMIFAGQGVEEVESFQIFDRWGNQVFFQGPFQPNDPLFGWDGTHRGEELNAAVFVYFAEIRLITGETVILEGEVLLLK